MTAYRFVTLTCDGCGEIWDHGIAVTFAEARGFARLSGWSFVREGSQDYCGRCTRKRKV